ncbi:MAG: Na+/H+ antiporter NhaA [Pseudomonadota bacterium]
MSMGRLPSNSQRERALPPEAWRPVATLVRLAVRPLDHFFRIEAASGIVLLVSAAVALFWANSPWAASYRALWHTHVGFHIGALAFENTLEWLVNDVLMAVFFFVVGMEIRKEAHDGELSEWRRAVLPALAAVGGMLVPAALYMAAVTSNAARPGWGIPMATDIAFAVGVLTLLGARVPPALRTLLLALAVIDDLGAILVIAIFYSSGIAWSGLAIAALGLLLIVLMRAIGIRSFAAYVPPAALAWAGTYASGIHPTIAGVAVGLLTPVQAWVGASGFVDEARSQAQHVSEELASEKPESALVGALNRVTFASREAVSPAQLLIDSLHPWVAFLIMPLFALANAGVDVRGLKLGGAAGEVSLAIMLALILGKPLGVMIVSFIALRLRVAILPEGLAFKHVAVLGVVAGIGFTMSLFIAQLGFADATLLAAAKLAVLVASATAMLLGLVLGRVLLSAPRSAIEAHSSAIQTH